MNFDVACRASDVIRHLQALIAEHGDRPLCAADADTDWLLPIGIVPKPADLEGPERFEITTDYHMAPKGAVKRQ